MNVSVRLQAAGGELMAALGDGRVWLALATALLFGGVCLALGTWVVRKVGLLDSTAPRGETIGVGLGSGLIILASLWAAIFSGGRSSFTPVAVGFAVVLAIALWKTIAKVDRAVPSASTAPAVEDQPPHSRRSTLLVFVAGIAFVIFVGLLYGATMIPSPRDGVQPVEFPDDAYYSVLGANLAQTGTETLYSPSGFDMLPGLPVQTWYHWGELWLSAIVIFLFGLNPIIARYYVVLPLLLLAAAALTGTLVRRMAGTSSPYAFLFGAAASLFLTRIPIPDPYFASIVPAMIFGIIAYGLSAIIVLLALFIIISNKSRPPSMARAVFSGSVMASILPAHIVIAILAITGTGGVLILRSLGTLVRKEKFTSPGGLEGTLAVTGLLVIATIIWGILTGHGIGNSTTASSVFSFNYVWRESVASVIVGSGAFLLIPLVWLDLRKEPALHAWFFNGTIAVLAAFALAWIAKFLDFNALHFSFGGITLFTMVVGGWALLTIPLVWFIFRRQVTLQVWICAGTVILLITGAIAWGARLGDFNMFHFFIGGFAVFAIPVTAVTVWQLWERLRNNGHPGLAATIMVLCGIQLVLGIANSVKFMQIQSWSQPISVNLLEAIRQLPPHAKIAYACQPLEDWVFWESSLISINAHTGRPAVPMCFQADQRYTHTYTKMSVQIQSPYFGTAPQHILYPTADAQPSTASVVTFLKKHGIGYIYADSYHPNSLVPDALPIAISGNAQLLAIPFTLNLQ